MKQYLLAAMTGALATPAFATCPYPLDATATQYAQAGMTPFPYVNYQSAEYVATPTFTPAGALFNVNYIAFSDSAFTAATTVGAGEPFGDVTLPASGIVGFELNVDSFPATADIDSNLYIGGGFTSGNALLAPDASDAFSFNFVFANSGSGSLSGVVAGSRSGGVVTWGQGNVGALALPLPANTRVGIYLNLNTRQVGYTVNGTDYGYLASEQGGSFTIPAGVQKVSLALNGIMQVAGGSLVGQPVGATLVTESANFTQPFPAGTTDICLGSTPGGLKLPNGKPYPGKANPAGLQKFQSLALPLKPLGLSLKP